MQPLNDNELSDLLRRWEAPAAPQHLERRIFGEPREQPWYRWVLTGSVRVPVPVLALLILAVLSALTYALPRSRQAPPASVREVTLSDFQPVTELKPRIIRRAHESK